MEELTELLGKSSLADVKEVAVNKGTGAGGSNTNLFGKKFEDKTNNEVRLLEQGFIKHTINKTKCGYYLEKEFPHEQKKIVFVLQTGLKIYMKEKFDIELFRCPDEAYIITYNTGITEIKILEKKEQNVEGSVETKLWSCPSLKREYELVLGDEFNVTYGLCVSEFLEKKFLSKEDKKYSILNQILQEHDIEILFGDIDNYFEELDAWVNK